MERIKDAIEKAKQQQPFVASKQVAHSQTKPSALPEDHVIAVDYQQTKVVHIEPAHLRKHRIIAFDKTDQLTLSFDILRTQVLSKMKEHGWRTLAITSPVPECGKTVTAINLALSIAQHTSQSAMLVDFDLRRPRVANYLGLTVEKTLNDVLEGKTEISEVLINPDIPRFVVLPTARPFKRPSETLSSNKVKSLIEDVCQRYHDRIVLFDLPPLLSADDVMAVLPHIDCVLVVVGNGMVTASEMSDSLRYLQNANLLGVALNKAEVKNSNYYY